MSNKVTRELFMSLCSRYSLSVSVFAVNSSQYSSSRFRISSRQSSLISVQQLAMKPTVSDKVTFGFTIYIYMDIIMLFYGIVGYRAVSPVGISSFT